MKLTSASNCCDLCGLALRGGPVSAVWGGKSYAFCCLGCRQVFHILLEATASADPAQFRATELFRQCQEKGIIPRSQADLTHPPQADLPERSISVPDDHPTPAAEKAAPARLRLDLQIGNMWCPPCAWLIDEILKKTPGVLNSICNFSTDRLQVAYDPVQTSPTRIIETLARIGYQAAVPGEAQEALALRREFMRFAIAAFLTMNIMMLSWALYSGFFARLTADTVYKLSWPAFIMATGVLVYGGRGLYRKAWAGIRHAVYGMETLIVVGALSAYFYSTFNLFRGSIHLFYDTAAMLITLVLLGKTLERRAKGQVLADLATFFALQPTKVRICNDDFPEGRYVAAEYLRKNDVFRVDEGEINPADGRILSGTGAVEESSLTGEAAPIPKRPNELLKSGARILRGSFKIRAERVGTESTLGQMIAIMQQTLLAKTPLEGKTDIILHRFVPFILVLAAGTVIGCRLAGLSLPASILRGVTVMVISCPCALGIAIPLARVAGISLAGQQGILVRDFAAFERASQVNAVVFDKTGTLTQGNWSLLDIFTRAPYSPEQVLALAAGLERDADHFIGLEIKRCARQKSIRPARVENIRKYETGLCGFADGDRVKIGSAAFLGREGADIHPFTQWDGDGSLSSSVFLSINGRVCAVFVFGDTLRQGTEATIKKLGELGYRIALVSGDGDATAKTIGKKIGIQEAYGGKLPREKAAFVGQLRQQGYKVAMVGDGLNDAPALIQADLSLAVYSGGHLDQETADITLMRSEPWQMIDFLKLAAEVNKKIDQNLVFTFLYNVIAIPIAMSGWLTPLVGVCAMLLSSISVTGNTLLLIRKNF
ncbi:MAG: heavy metal translocating P-type ATPase [Desulfobacterales bacterium]|nr:MAG: heavy metal translocating P-type ATPase [Desulfobacterales bacterium]